MQPRIIKLIIATGITLLFLIILEVLTTALLPSLGWDNFRLSFNVIIVLYLALKMNSTLLPWFVMTLQMVHSVFSAEGWAVGTIVGILISNIVSYLKDIVQFSSALMTMLTIQIFQVIWYIMTSAIICLKLGSFEKFSLILMTTLPATFALSLVSPLVFKILDRIWKMPDEDFGRTGVEI
jgi:hypothetical protein